MAETKTEDGPGKLKNGFNMIARDLDRAFAGAFLGAYETFVLQHARECCWAAPLRTMRRAETRPEPTPHKINVTQLAEDSGMSRRLLSRGLNSLITAKILTRYKDGSVLINKNYREWVFPASNSGPERPRFTPTQLHYIGASNGRQTENHCHPQVAIEASKSIQDCHSEVAPLPLLSGTDCHSEVAPTATQKWHPHIEERTRGRDLETKETINTERVDVLKFDSLSPKDEACPKYPEGDGGMWDIAPGQYPMSEDQARRLFKAIWDNWKNQRICFEFYCRQQSYTYEVWRAAFRKAKEQGKAINSIGYVVTIATDYQANGLPSPKPSQAGSRPSSQPSVPIKPLNPPGTVIPAKYLNPPRRNGSA